MGRVNSHPLFPLAYAASVDKRRVFPDSIVSEVHGLFLRHITCHPKIPIELYLF
jgi:hypothetical protein